MQHETYNGKAEQPSNELVSPVVETPESNVVYYDAYDHGFTNGILKIPKSHFEDFIRHNGHKNEARERMAFTLKQKQEEEARLAQVQHDLLKYRNEIARTGFVLDMNAKRQDEETAKMEAANAEKTNLETRLEQQVIEYNWFNVLFFILIGFVFIGSDYLITFDVLYHGLDLEKWIATVLALAVSSISFIIKPTIDRIFEKPNLDGKKRRQNTLLIVVSIVALVVLGCLGYFREMYFAQNQERIALETEITELEHQIEDKTTEVQNWAKRQGNSPNNTLTADIKKLEENMDLKKQEILKDDKATRSHGILYFIFIFSNVLFGLAGAICLSIGFPGLDRLRLRYKYRIAVKRCALAVKLALANLVRLQDEQISVQTSREEARNAMDLLPDPHEIELNIKELNASMAFLTKMESDSRAQSEIALYNEAFQRGMACELSEKVIISIHQMRTILRKHSNVTSVPGSRNPRGTYSNGGANSDPKDDRYMYQQIRNLIEYNHQNKKHLLNGEED